MNTADIKNDLLTRFGQTITTPHQENLRISPLVKKLFFFDVETTGLDSRIHAITEFAFIYRSPTQRITGSYKMCPHKGAQIDMAALSVTGTSYTKLIKRPDPAYIFGKFIDTIDSVIDKYDTQDKVYPVAYNGHFDYDFLRQWFEHNKNPYCGSYFNNRVIDPLALLRYIDYRGLIALPSYKLSAVCEHFGVPLDKAHTALADVEALEKLFDLLNEKINVGEF